MALLDGVRFAVAATAGVVASAVTLIESLAERLAQAVADEDMESVQAIIDDLNAQKQSLADAVANNGGIPDESEAAAPITSPEAEVAGASESSGDGAVDPAPETNTMNDDGATAGSTTDGDE